MINIPGIEIDTRIAPIKSRVQLNDYLAAHPGPDNPLFPLTERNKKRFLDSLFFTDRGLASFDASVLESSLSVSEVYHVLSLFGLQRAAHVFDGARIESEADRAVIRLAESEKDKTDNSTVACPVIQNYKCQPPATCSYAPIKYCVTCNCSIP